MSKRHIPRATRAERVRLRLELGPVWGLDPRTGHLSHEDAQTQYRAWYERWIQPDLEALVPELRTPPASTEQRKR